MHNKILLLALMLVAINVKSQQTGNYTDPRDGKTYKTVKIGTQTWLAENLAYKPSVGNYYIAKYGYLYDWQTAVRVCPMGWHLPSKKEWEILENCVGTNAGFKLKSKNGWLGNGNGSDIFGFKAFPNGYRADGNIILPSYGFWWSTTTWNENHAIMIYIGDDKNEMFSSAEYMGYLLSVRCIED